MAKCATEFLGTFFLVLTIGLVVVQDVVPVPVAVGSVLTALVYMGGHVSGAHYNPAVSVSLVLAGKLPPSHLLGYVGAQLLGSLAAAAAVRALTGGFLVIAPVPGTPVAAALLAEVLFTAALVLVILNVAASRRTKGNQYYGAAIGLTVMAGVFATGGISGGVFNPAVATGPILAALADGGSLGALWIYWAAPVAGGLVATGAFWVQEGGSESP